MSGVAPIETDSSGILKLEVLELWLELMSKPTGLKTTMRTLHTNPCEYSRQGSLSAPVKTQTVRFYRVTPRSQQAQLRIHRLAVLSSFRLPLYSLGYVRITKNITVQSQASL